MAKKFLIGINLNRNELQNAVVQPLASAPSSPSAGLIYFDTTLDKFGVYDGTQWVYMGDFDGSDYVTITGNQSIGGVKTFTSFPLTPSSAPTNQYQVANKKYVDDAITAGGGYTNEDAVDAVGTALTNSTNIIWTYDDVADIITAELASAVTIDDLYINNGIETPEISSGANPLLIGNDIDMQGAAITNMADPTNAQDSATKNYVDTELATKADTADIPTALTDLDTSVTGAELDAIQTRVNSLDAAVVLRGSWSAGASTFPGGGTAQAGDSYIVDNEGAVDGVDFKVGDRIVAITDNASETTYDANWLKLDYTDQVLSVNTKTGEVVLDTSDVDDTTDRRYVTDAEKTVLGNTSGTNTGDEPTASTTVQGIVELATTTEAQAKTDTQRAVTPAGLATFTRKYTGLIGDGSATSIAVTHGLGSQYVTAQAFDATTNALVECDITLTSSTQTTFSFSTAPTSNELRVVIVG